MSKEQIEKFRSRVDVGSPDECWEWVGPRFPTGYGRVALGIKARKPTEYAHRIALSLHLGRDLEKWCLHDCDNPSCCNPAHLREGTMQDNVDDRNKKGRQAFLKGESNGMSKLTADQVIQMRIDKARGSTVSELSSKYCVSMSAVSEACSRRTWRHLP